MPGRKPTGYDSKAIAVRIVYLHQYFNTLGMIGGTRSYEMARRLVAHGHEVHMVTTRRNRAAGPRGDGSPRKQMGSGSTGSRSATRTG